MFGHLFYHSVIRKYIVIFGTLFNEIYIQRKNSDGYIVDEFKIPLSYGPRDKMLARTEADPDLNRPPSITLPRMSFEVTSINYDSTRKLSTIGRSTTQTKVPGATKYAYNPVPYNFNFQLSIMVKNAEDGTKILEQILPFFTPEWTVTMRHVDGFPSSHDIPIVLQSVTSEDQYTDSFEQRRALIWTLDFVLKGYVYGPVRESKVISRAIGSLFSVDGDLEFTAEDDDINSIIEIDAQPALTANGLPVNTAPENANVVVSGISNFAVASIAVVNRGAGYSNANITISPPSFANAVVQAIVSSNSVTNVNVITPGGYYSTPPVVTIDPPQADPQTAAAIAIVSNTSISGIDILDGGRYYLETPNVVIAPPSGAPIQATGTAQTQDGKLTNVTLVNPGRYYLVAPTVTITNITFSQPPVVTAEIANGVVTGLTIVDQGVNVLGGNPILTIQPPTGTANDFTATAVATVSNNIVSNIDVVYPGVFYDTSPDITVDEPTGTANDFTATAVSIINNGIVSSVVVTEQGQFYNGVPNVSIGTVDTSIYRQATAVPVITEGRVTSAKVTDGGFGYLQIPQAQISNADLISISSNNITSNTDFGIVVTVTENL